MTAFFRALVMLVTLVGLPAAWVYYGPLPQGAQQVVDRFVEVARDALGWRKSVPTDTARGEMKSAPRFDEALPTRSDFPPVSRAAFQGNNTPVKLASASETLPTPPQPMVQDMAGQDLNDEMERHLSLLKKLGVAQYSLEKWGAGYRFKCAVPLGDNPDFARQFEVIDADPLATVRQVVGEVTSWQNARHDVADSATMWR
jgi:hypothetical protein